MERELLLSVKGLKKHFPIRKGVLNRVKGAVKAVDGISFDVYKGETLGIVGESGCGKSTTGRLIIGLQEATEGEVWYRGKNILQLKRNEMKEVRGSVQMIFQDPYSSLNPKWTIEKIISEPIDNYLKKTKSEKNILINELLETAGMDKSVKYRYPHEFSGGQRQRIGIARALALNPEVLIADEPVSALDVSIQGQVLNLLSDLQKDLSLTYIFVSHDLTVIDHFCDRVLVMYLGKVVEISKKEDLYSNPLHPYTQALLSAIPSYEEKKERILLKGDVPSPSNIPSGCPFHTRCPLVMEKCREIVPELQDMATDQKVACHLYNKI